MGFNFWFYSQAVCCGVGLASGDYFQAAFNLLAAALMLYVHQKDKNDIHDH